MSQPKLNNTKIFYSYNQDGFITMNDAVIHGLISDEDFRKVMLACETKNFQPRFLGLPEKKGWRKNLLTKGVWKMIANEPTSAVPNTDVTADSICVMAERLENHAAVPDGFLMAYHHEDSVALPIKISSSGEAPFGYYIRQDELENALPTEFLDHIFRDVRHAFFTQDAGEHVVNWLDDYGLEPDDIPGAREGEVWGGVLDMLADKFELDMTPAMTDNDTWDNVLDKYLQPVLAKAYRKALIETCSDMDEDRAAKFRSKVGEYRNAMLYNEDTARTLRAAAGKPEKDFTMAMDTAIPLGWEILRGFYDTMKEG